MAALLLLLTVNLSSVPAPVWDEGWTLAVARNLVEYNHYGQYLSGQPAPVGLAASFPVVLPVVISFRLLGIGLWQGRLPGVLFTLLSFALVYFLAASLYGRRTGMATLVVLLLMSGSEQLNPILIGRQVLGEAPTLAFLLTGYCLFYQALKKKPWLLVLACMAWGLALNTKSQALPFWLASMVLPLSVAWWKGWRREGLLLLAALAGGLAAYRWGWDWLPALFIHGTALYGASPQGIYQVTAVVLSAPARELALRVAFSVGLPVLLGMGVAAWRLWRALRLEPLDAAQETLRMVLLGLAASWFGWYVALGMYWPRYLFPAFFVGSIFAAVFLDELTQGFNVRQAIHLAAATILQRRVDRVTLGSLLAVVLGAMTIPLTLAVFVLSFAVLADNSYVQAAAYLNQNTPAGALVETYETPVFFLLQRPYHFPPDQVNVQMNRRAYLGEDVPLDYDPLAADPDYLLLGPVGEKYKLYAGLLAGDQFRLAYQLPRYQVYQRMR